MTDGSKVRGLAAALVVLFALNVLVLLDKDDSTGAAPREAERSSANPNPAEDPPAAGEGRAPDGIGAPDEPDSPGSGSSPSVTVPPSDSPSSRATGTFPTYGTYEPLKPEDRYPMNPRPEGWDTVMEGARQDGSKWQLYAHRNGSGGVCVRSFAWDNRTGRGGGGGHQESDCPSPERNWGWTLSDDGEGYVAVQGFAPAGAARIVLVARDGREAAVPAVSHSGFGVSFFMAWLDCETPDLSRFEAREASGRLMGTYSLEEFPIPSTHCELVSRNP